MNEEQREMLERAVEAVKDAISDAREAERGLQAELAGFGWEYEKAEAEAKESLELAIGAIAMLAIPTVELPTR